jgi:phage baseplate assembly protein W
MPEHFAIPFRYDPTGSAATVPQDSVAEISQCVQVLLSTPTGTRIEQMDYGIPDPTFSSESRAVADITQALAKWETRANGTRLTVTVNPDGSAQIIAKIPDEVRP